MPTTQEIEYAVLANAAYRDTRNELQNAPVIPAGWTRLSRTALGFSEGPSPSGFSAEAFQKGTDIVISYQGTNSDPFTKDGYRDWGSNIANYLGWASNQMKEAALFYQRVKAQNPNATNITFTGHSLGGGLAGLMSIFFDRPAVVFDSAPFQGSASAQNARLLRDYLAAQATSDAHSGGRAKKSLHRSCSMRARRRKRAAQNHTRHRPEKRMDWTFPAIDGRRLAHTNVFQRRVK